MLLFLIPKDFVVIQGGVTVFLVVHRATGESIEKFKYIPERNSLKHIETITNNTFIWK